MFTPDPLVRQLFAQLNMAVHKVEMALQQLHHIPSRREKDAAWIRLEQARAERYAVLDRWTQYVETPPKPKH